MKVLINANHGGMVRLECFVDIESIPRIGEKINVSGYYATVKFVLWNPHSFIVDISSEFDHPVNLVRLKKIRKRSGMLWKRKYVSKELK